MSLPYARFVQIGRTIGEAMADEMIDEHRLLAFVGWQDHLNQMMVWGGKVKSFKEWLVHLRLAEPDKPLTPEEEKEIEAKAIADAEDILKQFGMS